MRINLRVNNDSTSTAVGLWRLLSTHPHVPLSSSPPSLLTISRPPAITVRDGQTHPRRPRLLVVVSFSTMRLVPRPAPRQGISTYQMHPATMCSTLAGIVDAASSVAIVMIPLFRVREVHPCGASARSTPDR